MTRSSPAKNSDGRLSDGARSVLSLVIFVHLFCTVIALFGNESTSVLLTRLRGALAPYTRLLNLDPQFLAGFHLTHAMEMEDDHQLVIQVTGEPAPRVWPPRETGWSDMPLGFRHRRWQNLSLRVGMMVADGDDQVLAELARAIGESVLEKTAGGPVAFSCRRFRPPELTSDSAIPARFEDAFDTLYTADIIRDTQGRVRVHKRVEATEAAPVR